MFNSAIRLIAKEWKLSISYFLIFLFLQTVNIYLFSKFELFIAFFEIYIFYSFLYAFKFNMESKDKIEFSQSLKAIDKANIINYLVLPKLSDFEFGSTILPLLLVKYRDYQ